MTQKDGQAVAQGSQTQVRGLGSRADSGHHGSL
jgi:hypothetical protein